MRNLDYSTDEDTLKASRLDKPRSAKALPKSHPVEKNCFFERAHRLLPVSGAFRIPKTSSGVVRISTKAAKNLSARGYTYAEANLRGWKVAKVACFQKSWGPLANFSSAVYSAEPSPDVKPERAELVERYQLLTDADMRGGLSLREQEELKLVESRLDELDQYEANEVEALSSYKKDISKLDELIRLNKEIEALL